MVGYIKIVLVFMALTLFAIEANSTEGLSSQSQQDKDPLVIEPYIIDYRNGTVVRYTGGQCNRLTCRPPPSGIPNLQVKDLVTTFSNRVLRARAFLPGPPTGPSKKLPILVYFHGGAFCIGSAFAVPDTQYLGNVSVNATAMVFSVHYPLYPDATIPAPYDEAWAFLQWVVSPNGSDPWIARFGDLGKIFVGGDSAGGNIAHQMAVRAGQDPSVVKLTGAFLAMPYFLGNTPPLQEDPGLNKETDPNHRVWHYTCPSCKAGIDDPLINPIAPGALSLRELGVERMMVYLSLRDFSFLARQRAYIEHIKNSGWPGQIEVIEVNLLHVFHVLFGFSIENSETQKFILDLNRFIHA